MGKDDLCGKLKDFFSLQRISFYLTCRFSDETNAFIFQLVNYVKDFLDRE